MRIKHFYRVDARGNDAPEAMCGFVGAKIEDLVPEDHACAVCLLRVISTMCAAINSKKTFDPLTDMRF